MFSRRRRFDLGSTLGVRVNQNTPLSIRPTRRFRRGIITDEFTLTTRGPGAAPVELTQRQLFNTLRALALRSPNPERTFVTLQYRGTGRLVYRSIKGEVLAARNAEAAFRRFQARLNVFEAEEGVSGTQLDDRGNPLTLISHNFSVVYGGAPPPRLIGWGSWRGDYAGVTAAQEIVPFAESLGEEWMHHMAVHCVDSVCFYLGIPFYSRRANRPPDEMHEVDIVPPDWHTAEEYIRQELKAKYPNNEAAQQLYVLHPYQLQCTILSLRELTEFVTGEKFSDVSPRQIVHHHDRWYHPMTPSMIYQIYDENCVLENTGPHVVLRGKEHVEYCLSVYDESLKSWVPILRQQKWPLYLGSGMELWRLRPKKRLPRQIRELPDEQQLDLIFSRWPNEWAQRRVGEFPGLTMESEAKSHVSDENYHEESKKLCSFNQGVGMLERLMSSTDVRKTAVSHSELWVYWDGETVYDARTGKLRMYSLCYLPLEVDEALHFHKHKEDEAVVGQLMEKAKVFYGWECVQDFVMYLTAVVAQEKYAKITLKTFNGSGFDNFFLAQQVDELQEIRRLSEVDPELAEEQPVLYFSRQFFTAGRLLSATLRGRGIQGELSVTEVVFFDVMKHMPGMSLNACGKAFQTKARKKEGFSHTAVQKMFETNPIDFWTNPELFEELTVYNKMDCVVLFQVEMEYREAMSRMSTVYSMSGDLPLTIGSAVRQHWAEAWQDMKDKPGVLHGHENPTVEELQARTVHGTWEPLDVTSWKALRLGIPGGWVNLPNGPMEVNERVSSLDVKGLYSFIMAMWDQVYFPAGNIMHCGAGEAHPGEYYGAYNIDVHMDPLQAKNLMYILPQKVYSRSCKLLRNNWNECHVYDTWVTTPILEILRLHRCGITYRRAIEYTQYVRGYDLFNCLVPFLCEKKRQDKLKGTPEYNAALRMVSKLFMNTAYGQMLIGLFERSVVGVNEQSFNRLFERADIEKINVINVIGERVYADITKTTESKIHKQGPYIVGAFVLGYSQKYMIQKLFHRLPKSAFLYLDTDAGKARYVDFVNLRRKYADEKIEVWPEIKRDIPETATALLYGGSEGGCFEEELPDNGGAIFVAKKTYVVKALGGQGVAMEGPNHPIMGAKGIRREDVPLSMYEVEQLRGNIEANEEARNIICSRVYEEGRTISEVGDEFLREVLRENVGFVLCSSMSRVTSNSMRNVQLEEPERWEKDMMSVVKHFSLKRIMVHGPELKEGEQVGQAFEGDEAEQLREIDELHDVFYERYLEEQDQDGVDDGHFDEVHTDYISL